MKLPKILGLFMSLLVLPALAEERYFRFPYPGREAIDRITRIVSIDKVKDGWVYAYANDKGWKRWERVGITAELLPHPGSLNREIGAAGSALTRAWASYPSYTGYVDMMQNFASTHPSLCEVTTFGRSTKNRSLMVARITSNISENKPKPKVFLASTMHGDETTGYSILLRLIDYLLVNYNQTTSEGTRITRLLDNAEIWISPLLNPDGTYRDNDSTIASPTRGNSAGVDLNRNFPDIKDGQHPDGEAWQPETIAMMDFAKQHRFVIAANMHGGAEVVSYPWDTMADRHVDDAWWIEVSRRYADNAQTAASGGYMTDLQNGVTNGYDWYRVAGGRQDYMNYHHGNRELTLELSATKFLPSSQLDSHWNYNRNALLTFAEEVMKGVKGKVTDAKSGLPLSATVALQATNEMPVQTDPGNGSYFRVLRPGTYTFVVKADGHETKTLTNVAVTSGNATTLDVQLQPSGLSITKQPVAQTVAVGASVTFSVTATGGKSPYTYQWRRAGTPISGATGASYTFTAQTGDHNLAYSVVVTDSSNPAATATSQDAILTVTPATTTSLTETEANNTIATANLVSASITRITGTIGASGDIDHFSLKVGAGRDLKVTMTGPTGTTYDYDLYLYRPAGTQLGSSTSSTTSETINWKNTDATETTVIVAVKGYKGFSTQKTYTLTLTR